jgi:cysteine sulfinate desulfinase/cysteine desulfurase-like protein
MSSDEAAETVRFSLGELTQLADIDFTVKALKNILK